MTQILAHADAVASKPYEMPIVLKVEAEPPEVVANVQTGRNRGDISDVTDTSAHSNWMMFELTAYTAGYESTQKKRGEPGYGITASGAPVREGVTIACPPSMAFGTTVEIEGLGERTCQDRGSAITEGHIDVYMDDLNDARAFGRQERRVRILK